VDQLPNMSREKNRTNLYILLVAVIVAAITAYYLPTRHPENTDMMSPKEYLELAEKKKEQRSRYEQEQREREAAQKGATADPSQAQD
jgi:hypothetical protein